MARRYYAPPPRFTDAQLEAARTSAIQDFIQDRASQGDAEYLWLFARNVELVRELLATTDDLRNLGSGIAIQATPSLLEAARYLTAPPLSADDLDTMALRKVSGRRSLDISAAQAAALVIDASLDPERFPWLFTKDPQGKAAPRSPTPAEREAAIRWTAGLQTVQRIQTLRRGASSKRQEKTVADLLSHMGFTFRGSCVIDVTGGLDPGEFCRESHVMAIKCDIPVGLRDGRFLLLECKVSNSATNSVKRLNREVAGKAVTWRAHFGDRVVVGAVLAGVYKLKNLKDAQEAGVAIFWERDLAPLVTFVDSAV